MYVLVSGPISVLFLAVDLSRIVCHDKELVSISVEVDVLTLGVDGLGQTFKVVLDLEAALRVIHHLVGRLSA